MTTAKALFLQHLDNLSKMAEGKGLLLDDVLPFLIGDPPVPMGFGVHRQRARANYLQLLIEPKK